jgi:GT2 family glycosyltransferase
MKNVFVSILNFNTKKNTIECLNSFEDLRISNDIKLTIVVLDNGSKETFDFQRKSIGKIPVVVVKNKKNLGFTGGHNQVIQYSLSHNADYVVLLNSDTVVDKFFINELVKTAQEKTDAGMLVPKIYFAPKFEFHKDRYSKDDLGKVFWYAGGKMDWQNIIGSNRGVDAIDQGQFDKVEETEISTGCCVLLKKEALEKVGAFDDSYFLYYEDADLSMRMKKKGFKIFYVPKSVIWHKNAKSSGGSGSALQDYYITRNRLVFGTKYAPFKTKLALLKESLNLLFNGREYQRKGVIDFYLRALGKGSYKI